MRANLHPTWYPQAKMTCVCGNTFTTGSTKPEIRVDICSMCHPFFTGQQKFVDIQGRVEMFGKAKTTSEAKKAERAKILQARSAKVQKEKTEKPTLKDLLLQARKQTVS